MHHITLDEKAVISIFIKYSPHRGIKPHTFENPKRWCRNWAVETEMPEVEHGVCHSRLTLTELRPSPIRPRNSHRITSTPSDSTWALHVSPSPPMQHYHPASTITRLWGTKLRAFLQGNWVYVLRYLCAVFINELTQSHFSTVMSFRLLW